MQSFAQPTQNVATTSNISGTVINSVTHEPIGRALVYSADGVYATFTDDHGHFELSLPEMRVGAASSSSGTVIVSSFGGQSSVVGSYLQAKKPGFLASPVTPIPSGTAPGREEVTLSLIPEGLIVGRVKFPTAESADHVRVELYRREIREGFAQWTQLAATETRSDGEFRFAGLRAGEYKVFTSEAVEQDPLTAVPNGPVFAFPPRYFAAARDFATADTIQVRAGESFTANIALERQRYYEVRVPVVGIEPGSQMGLGVSVFAQGHRGPGFELGYSRSQAAIIGSLPNGNYTIEASGFGPNAVTGMVNITVTNGPVNGPALAVTPNTSIEVNVHQDLTGADSSHPQPEALPPGRTAYVSLMSAEEVPNRRGRGGQYQAQGDPAVLGGVAPGRYWVQIQGGMGYAASVTSGGRDLLRLPLVVPYGASVPPIEITLRYVTGEIEVSIEPSANRAPSSANGGATDSAPMSSTVTQPGNVSLYCVPVGNQAGPIRESHFGRVDKSH